MSSKEKKEPQNYINQLRLQLARSQNKSYESIFSQIISYLTELKNNGVNISSIESPDGYTCKLFFNFSGANLHRIH